MLSSARKHSRSCLGWLKIRFYWLSASCKLNVLRDCSPRYSFLWTSCLDWLYVLGRLSAPVSYCKHTINLINQFVSKNVISVVNVHGCVSMSMSMSSLVDMVCKCVIMSVTRSEDADYKNTNSFFSLFVGISFQKENSLNHQRHMFALNANSLGHRWITLTRSPNAW